MKTQPTSMLEELAGEGELVCQRKSLNASIPYNPDSINQSISHIFNNGMMPLGLAGRIPKKVSQSNPILENICQEIKELSSSRYESIRNDFLEGEKNVSEFSDSLKGIVGLISEDIDKLGILLEGELGVNEKVTIFYSDMITNANYLEGVTQIFDFLEYFDESFFTMIVDLTQIKKNHGKLQSENSIVATNLASELIDSFKSYAGFQSQERYSTQRKEDNSMKKYDIERVGNFKEKIYILTVTDETETSEIGKIYVVSGKGVLFESNEFIGIANLMMERSRLQKEINFTNSPEKSNYFMTKANPDAVQMILPRISSPQYFN